MTRLSSGVQLTQPATAAGDARSEYGRDVYAWAMEQARLLRASRFDEIDIANVAEEIESVGRSERSGLTSYLARIMQHRLKWDHQPERRTRGWLISIRIHQVHAERQLRLNSGLKGQIEDILDDAYALAVLFAAEETGLTETEFPRRRPYDLETVLRPHEEAS